MSGVLDSIVGAYNYMNYELGDSRTNDFALITSPLTIAITVIVYLKFCTDYGPRFMKNRKPFELKYPIMAYNIFQVLLSMFLVSKGLKYFTNDYNLICDPMSESDDPRILNTATGSWWYFFAKITELLDTIFFVFRKKSKQISTLHLYHHSIVVVTSWMAVKYFPIGPIVLVGTLNSFVHILMYSYYFIAGLGPKYQKYLWWKKYITLIQLIQFVIVIAHNTTALFHDCNYPKLIHIFLIVNTGYIFYMFSIFYYNTYIKVNPKKSEDVNKKDLGQHARKEKRLSVGQ